MKRHAKATVAISAMLLLIVFGATVASADNPPSLSVQAASEVGYLSAKLNGEVNPEGGPSATSWHFEYSASPEGSESWVQFDGGGSFEGTDAEKTESLAVQSTATGLKAGHTYLVRLIAENEGGANRVESPAPYLSFTTKAVAAPSVEPIDVSAIATTSAHFKAQVNPNAPEDNASLGAEAKEAFETSWSFSCTPQCVGLKGGTLPADDSVSEVSRDALNLDPNTEYTLTLTAQNRGGKTEASTTFTTSVAPPAVIAYAAGPVSFDRASINGQVNPNHQPTTYWFEWGTKDCSANPCQAIPASKDADAGAGSLNVYVLHQLEELEPGTTYHFRLIAKNATGTTEGDDQEFTTAAEPSECANAGMAGTNFLPDCRAWEMVSPPDKNGGDVIVNSSKTVAAEVGDGVAYPAIEGFGDVKGTSTDAQYLSRRTGKAGTNGWSTHAIDPTNRAPTLFGLVLGYAPTFSAEFTPDLSTAIYRTAAPLTNAPNVADRPNLYRLSDLDSDSQDTQLLSSSVSPLALGSVGERFVYKPLVAGASTDLSHVIFQSPWKLTGDGSFFEPENLYEYADGIGTRLVGRVPTAPDTECDEVSGPPCVDAESSQAGIDPRSTYSGGMISRDGSRIFFTAGGNLYLREDGQHTYQVNASEKDTPEAPKPATAWAMSDDGSRAFFTTGESLVDGDEGGPDLYMYDVTAPEGSRLTRISTNPDAPEKTCSAEEGVVGTSSDGHYIYFICFSGQLVPGESGAVVRGLYLWHDGEIQYIGSFAGFPEVLSNTPRTSFIFPPPSGRKTSLVSPDGRHLLFMFRDETGFQGRRGYPGYDHGTGTGESCSGGGTGVCRALYLYSADSGRLTCVSCNPNGHEEEPGDALTDVVVRNGASTVIEHPSHALTNDGRHVFFSSKESLLPEDTNGFFDAYEYDVPTGELHLLSSGTDDGNSYFVDSSLDGSDVFIDTKQRLVGWDIDENYDIYDVRVEGGFPEPAPVPAPCQGESCLVAPKGAPPAGSTPTRAAGQGNPKVRCAPGRRQVKRHGKPRCVKKQKKQKARAHNHKRGGAR